MGATAAAAADAAGWGQLHLIVTRIVGDADGSDHARNAWGGPRRASRRRVQHRAGNPHCPPAARARPFRQAPTDHRSLQAFRREPPTGSQGTPLPAGTPAVAGTPATAGTPAPAAPTTTVIVPPPA